MLIKTAHAAKAGYDNNHVKLIPNRPMNSRYFSNGQPYDTSSGLSFGFGAGKFYGGWDTYNNQSTSDFPNEYAGGIAVGQENFYVSQLFGGYNGMPSTWTIMQRIHDTANWKYSHAILELNVIYYSSVGYSRYFLSGYSTPSATLIDTVGGSTLGVNVANATQVSGNFYRYDIQATGLGNYQIAYFTLRTSQRIVAHPLTTAMYDTWRVNY